ncbi:ABC transporter permease [Phytohabitans houttuyneae]|uniref:Transport permease protein n=1 Tax=Phytohabitans houttuyneae TaxID=1076126 RepID=A0A6V8KK41_9ACTN|nr:ABC transporter permease [Phytohabitans houttuyneae]GFJ82529.1 ABC transporter [Phytohabitans houttuyneae]
MPTALPTMRRNWLVTMRAYPWTYFIGTVATGVLTVGLAYLAFHAIGGGQVSPTFLADGGTGDYLGYVTVGAAALMFSTRMVLWVAKAQITEQREGTLESQLLAPARRLPYLVGVGLQALTTTVAEVAVMLAFAVAIGVRLPAPDPLALLCAAAASAVAVFGISIPLSAVMISVGEAHITQNTLFVGMALLCGFTFPPALLPDPLRWLGEALPLTSGLRALRDAALHHAPVTAVLPDLLLCAGLGLAYLAVGLRLLGPAERVAVRRGGAA